MSIVPQTLAPPVATPIEVWRVAHRAAVGHLRAASWSECGCTADALCADGQTLEDRADETEARLPWRRSV